MFPGFDPDVLYTFRLYAITAQVLLWGLLGLVFGALAERATGRADSGATEREAVEV